MTAGQLAQLVIETDAASAAAGVKVRCAGAWTVQGIARLEQRLETLAWPGAGDLVIDAAAISALDTAGAWLLQRTVRALEQ
ncbi:MAG: STAS domain-containing protein, partial [Gammaproteobacteria bacterium]|nr:STAS domain-containing protein [Gammaproteobacteria bacterium]